MRRRSFLQGGITLGLTQVLLGCAGNNQKTLNIQLLRGSIPGQVVNNFRQDLQQNVQLNFAPVEQLRDLYQKLQTWHKQSQTTSNKRWNISLPFGSSGQAADLVTLGDYWLQTAIAQKLIQPLAVEQLKQWSNLPPRWQELVRRNQQGNLDPQGEVWAAPYRWGSTVIVYRRDKFQELGWTPTDWSDLWRDELRDRISLLEQPREVIGLVLKKLGRSYNTEDLNSVPELEKELRALNQQVKFYSSTRYLEPLIIGDSWLAVGWSNDVLAVLNRYPQLAAVTPQSGTALWADVWVRPAGVKNDLVYQWINFCWQPSIAQKIVTLTKTNSPIAIDLKASEIQEASRSLLLGNQKAIANSEFLLPLPPTVSQNYESLLAKIRN